ncbi:MAG: asparagine synthase (glutamine-hydrolyzing) [Thaumarchaeota archaeon]|nr:MAG: asparagine synthase (glutamine-hydrolyzing) [Nitrososphaerota archaeon]
MCGITGLVNFEDSVLLHNMCNVLKHRGPDADGFFQNKNASLGIRRLSIIDVDGGNQPISNEDGKIWTVFNGEIYNYKSLQEDLKSKGHKFQTNSDTETIVHAYEEYDLDFVNHLRGMFAIAIWDEKKNRTILIRDRLGVKPLYYHIQNNKLLFASELKALLEYDEINLTINHNAISDYLTYLNIPAPETVFNEIKKLRPAEMLIFNLDGNFYTKKYWSVKFQKNNLDEKVRMVSDVPVGILLSGGLDSSVVATIAAKKSNNRLNTYTVGFENKIDNAYDELKESKEMAEILGTNHHEIVVNSNDTFKILDKVTLCLDEPFGNPTTTLNYIISEFASKTSKVVLSGVGGDEMFGGYPKYRALQIFQEYRKFPKSLVKNFGRIFEKIPDNTSEHVVKGKTFFKAWKKNPEDQYFSLISYFDEKDKEKLLNFKTSLSSRRFIDDLFLESKKSNAKSFFEKLFFVESTSYLPNNILEYTDKTSMAVSLEVREPLLDHKIAEFAANIPFSLKIKNGSTKNILKIAMKDELPRNVLNRKKRGFTPPLINWLNNSISDLEARYFSEKRIKEEGFFDYEYIEKISKDYKNGKTSNYVKIWSIICLQSWFDVFMKKYNFTI